MGHAVAMGSDHDVDSLLAAESRLQRAQLTSDVDVLDDLLHPALTFVGPDGSLSDKAADLEGHRNGVIQLHVLEPDDVVAQVVDGVGVTVLTARLAGSYQGQPFDSRMRYTRTWVSADGAWRLLAAQAGMIAPGAP
jgi:hypothetical protein